MYWFLPIIAFFGIQTLEIGARFLIDIWNAELKSIDYLPILFVSALFGI